MKKIIKSTQILAIALVFAFPFFANADSAMYGGYDYGYNYGGYDYGNSYSGYDYGNSYGGYDYASSYGGYDYATSYGGYDYDYGYGGYDYDYSYGGYDYDYGYGGYDYATSYGGYDYATSYGGYDYDLSYGGYDYDLSYGGYDYDYSYGGYDYDWYPQYGGYDYGYGAPSYGQSYGGYDQDWYPQYGNYDYGYYDTGYGGGCYYNCNPVIPPPVIVTPPPVITPPCYHNCVPVTPPVVIPPQPAPLDAICIPSFSSIRKGESVTFVADVVGGTSPYTYRWTGAATSSNRSFTQVFNQAGTFKVFLRVTDAKGRTVTDECEVRVREVIVHDDAFDAICVPSFTTVKAGERVTFSARVDGGRSPFTYRWSGDGISGSNEELRVRFDDAGRYTVRLRVTDDRGRTATDECEVRVLDKDRDRDVTVTTGTITTPPAPSNLSSVGSVYLNQVPYTGPEEVAKGIAFVTLLLSFSAAAAMIVRRHRNKSLVSDRIAAFKEANRGIQN